MNKWVLNKQVGYKNAVTLVLLSVGLQACVLAGWLDISSVSARRQYGMIEMMLILLLWGNAAQIYLAIKANYSAGPDSAFGHASVIATDKSTGHLALQVAKLVWLSLSLCVLGDLVNRNFPELYFQYGSQVEHTYLADSVWFFFPGYGVFLYAVFLIGRSKGLSAQWMGSLAAVFALGGMVSFLGMHRAGTGIYVTMMTGTYATLIPLMLLAAVVLIRAYGWQRMKWVAIGAALATVADALIGNFWIYGEGYYPDIRAVNWIVYFLSQALIQRLPLKLLAVDQSMGLR